MWCRVWPGLLLPAATVSLLLLCNDRAVPGPRVNGRWTNLCTGAVIAGLMMLPIVLTASGLYPAISGAQVLFVLGGGTAVAVIAAGVTRVWMIVLRGYLLLAIGLVAGRVVQLAPCG